MIKEQFIAHAVEMHEKVFKDYIQYTNKEMEKWSSCQNVKNFNNSKNLNTFFSEKMNELPQYAEKIFDLIDNSEIRNLINEEDLEGFEVVSDGRHMYQVNNRNGQIICKLKLNISIRDKFYAPISEYPMSVNIGNIDANKNKLIFDFYDNSYKRIINKNIIEHKINKTFKILMYYQKILGLEVGDLYVKDFDIREITEKSKQRNEEIKIESEFFGEKVDLKDIEFNTNEYIFNLFKGESFEKIGFYTIEDFNRFFSNIKLIKKYIESIGINHSEINFIDNINGGFVNKENSIIMAGVTDGTKIEFYVKFDITDSVKGFSEKVIYIHDKNSSNGRDFRDTGFKLKDYSKNRESVLQYLKMMAY